ncbi:hypothetical protein ACRAWD_16245 [Caulobacter segnis]
MLAILALAASVATEPPTLPAGLSIWPGPAIDAVRRQGRACLRPPGRRQGNPLVVLRDDGRALKPPIAAPRRPTPPWSSTSLAASMEAAREDRSRVRRQDQGRSRSPEPARRLAAAARRGPRSSAVSASPDTAHETADQCARAALAKFPQFH